MIKNHCFAGKESLFQIKHTTYIPFKHLATSNSREMLNKSLTSENISECFSYITSSPINQSKYIRNPFQYTEYLSTIVSI